jgi:AcrR family transcriptional regulator
MPIIIITIVLVNIFIKYLTNQIHIAIISVHCSENGRRSDMSTSSSRQRRQQKTHQSIIHAARKIITEKGPEDLSMRSLAESIDYSPSGLYEYFDSKEEIIQAVCGEGHAQLAAEMRLVDENLSPEEYLIQIGHVYVDFATANPVLFQLMFKIVSGEPPDHRMLSERSSYSILLRAIQCGIDSGVFKPRAGFGLQEMAFAAWSMVHGISMLRIYMQDITPGFSAFKQQALSAIVRGLMTE